MKALKALLLIPMLPVLMFTVIADIFNNPMSDNPHGEGMTHRIVNAILS